MKILEKLTSKKGQVSMEIGILVAAAVAVASIAAYYYVKNAKAASENAGDKADKAVEKLGDTTQSAIDKIDNISVD
jgi:uncharacterized protein (UPF0333 family)